MSKQLEAVEEKEESSSGQSKCIPRSIKVSITKQPRSESMRSPPISEKPRASSDENNGSQRLPSSRTNPSSKRINEPVSGKKASSQRVDSFREEKEKEKVIKIDES